MNGKLSSRGGEMVVFENSNIDATFFYITKIGVNKLSDRYVLHFDSDSPLCHCSVHCSKENFVEQLKAIIEKIESD